MWSLAFIEFFSIYCILIIFAFGMNTVFQPKQTSTISMKRSVSVFSVVADNFFFLLFLFYQLSKKKRRVTASFEDTTWEKKRTDFTPENGLAGKEKKWQWAQQPEQRLELVFLLFRFLKPVCAVFFCNFEPKHLEFGQNYQQFCSSSFSITFRCEIRSILGNFVTGVKASQFY